MNKLYPFYLISGLIIASFFFYIRILKYRLPTDITFNWNLWLFLYYIIMSMLFIHIIKQNVYIKVSTNPIIIIIKKYTINVFTNWYNRSLETITSLIINTNQIPYFQREIMGFFYFFTRIIRLPIRISLYVYFFIVLCPRLIVSLAFMLDVIYFHKFYYFYKVMWLLIISLIWNVIYALIESKYKEYMALVTNLFTIDIEYDFKKEPETAYVTLIPKENLTSNLTERDIENYNKFYCNVLFHYEHFFIGKFNSSGLLNNYPFFKTTKILTLTFFLIGFSYLTSKLLLSYLSLYL